LSEFKKQREKRAFSPGARASCLLSAIARKPRLPTHASIFSRYFRAEETLSRQDARAPSQEFEFVSLMLF